MTPSAPGGSGPGSADLRSALAAAHAALPELRDRLVAASEDGDGSAALAAVRGYADAHGPALREVATTLLEGVRVQLLGQLYGWRAQVAAQVDAPRRKGSGDVQG